MNSYRNSKPILQSSSDEDETQEGYKMEQLQQQITELQYQLQQQRQQQQEEQQQQQQQQRQAAPPSHPFGFTASDILRHFTSIPIFSGENDYKLPTFLRNVNQAARLCGNDENFKAFCLEQVINCRISGRAQYCVQQLAENQRYWANVEQSLRIEFQPSSTIHQELYQARSLKVCNLKDLFEKLKQVECKCIEILEFNNDTLYNVDIVNRELVQIIIDHLVPTEQQHIDITSSLTNLHNRMCKTAIYSCPDIIQPYFRLKQFNNFRTHNLNNNYFIQHNNSSPYNTVQSGQVKQPHYAPNQYHPIHNTQDNIQNTQMRTNKFNSNQYHNSYINNSDRFRNLNFNSFRKQNHNNFNRFQNFNSNQSKQNVNNSGSYKHSETFDNSNRSNMPVENYSNNEPMEIDNINNQFSQKTYYQTPTTNHTFPFPSHSQTTHSYQNTFPIYQNNDPIQNFADKHVNFSNLPQNQINP